MRTQVLCLLQLILAGFSAPASAEAAKDWLYFDLGEVIVTGNPTAGYTYVPGAMEYLSTMRAAGFKLALITNIPESWGATCGLKYQMLQTFLSDRLHEPAPMEWTRFDAVVVPPFDRYRKPHSFMFLVGLANTCPGRALYVGEVAGEIGTAKTLGYATFQTPSTGPGEPVQSPLPPLATVQHLLDTAFTFEQPEGCNFTDLFDPVLAPQDQPSGVAPCVIDPASAP